MVRYLTWFARHHGALGEECLSNCSLVINGSELSSVLEDWFHDETKGGGIYQNYVRNVETFFYDLKRFVFEDLLRIAFLLFKFTCLFSMIIAFFRLTASVNGLIFYFVCR